MNNGKTRVLWAGKELQKYYDVGCLEESSPFESHLYQVMCNFLTFFEKVAPYRGKEESSDISSDAF